MRRVAFAGLVVFGVVGGVALDHKFSYLVGLPFSFMCGIIGTAILQEG